MRSLLQTIIWISSQTKHNYFQNKLLCKIIGADDLRVESLINVNETIDIDDKLIKSKLVLR